MCFNGCLILNGCYWRKLSLKLENSDLNFSFRQAQYLLSSSWISWIIGLFNLTLGFSELYKLIKYLSFLTAGKTYKSVINTTSA